MPSTSSTKKNSTSGITCAPPWRLATVKALDNYCLEVTFKDGTQGIVDLSQRVLRDSAGVFAVLKDINLFNQVYLDHGVVTWPGEIDLAPDAMHDEIQAHGTWFLT
ncbi:MAG: DUF2442 domain-containing protein [Gammaproteobacteria bacterium]